MALLGGLFGGSDRDRFADKVIGRIKARGWGGGVPEYSRETFSIRLDDEKRLFLENAFAAWSRAKGSDKDRQIEIAIGYLFEPPPDATFAEARPHLLPMVRNRADLTNLWLAPGNEALRGAYDGAIQPFCRDLAIGLVVDAESGMTYVTRSKLDAWDASFDDAFEIALQNLRSISPCRFNRDPAGFWVSDYGDHHDAARLLLPQLFGQLELAGDPVAVAPERSTLLLAGSEDPASLEALAAFCEDRFRKTDRPLACAPLALRDGQWIPVQSGVDGLPPLRRLITLQSLRDGAEQKGLLDARYKANGEEVFVAGLRSGVGQDPYPTWAMWMLGLDTLLPRADIIALARGAGDQMESLWRMWADVEAAFGPFTPEPDLYPPRYRLRQPPEGAWETAERLPKPDWAPS